MYKQVEKPKENKSRAVADSVGQKKGTEKDVSLFADNRPEINAQRKLQGLMNNATQTQKAEPNVIRHPKPLTVDTSAPVQRQMLVGCEMETMVPIYEKGVRTDHVDGYAAQATDYAHHNVDSSLSMPLGDGFEIHVDSSQLAYKSALNLLNSAKGMHIAELVAKPVSSRQALLANLKIARNYLSIFKENHEVTGTHYSMGWPRPTVDWKGLKTKQMAERFESDDNSTRGQLFKVSTQLTFQGSPDKLESITDMDKRTYDAGTKKQIEEFKTGRGKMRRTRIVPVKERHFIANTETMAKALGMKDQLGSSLVKRAVSVTVKIFKDALNVLQSEGGGTIKNKVPYLIRSDLGCLFTDVAESERNKFAAVIKSAIQSLKADALGLPEQLLKTIYSAQKDGIILNPLNRKALIDPQGTDEVGELEHVNKNLIESLKKHVDEDDKGYYYWRWQDAMEWLAAEVSTAVSTTNTDITGPLHGSQNLGLLAGRDPQQELEMLNTREQIVSGWVANPKESPLPNDKPVNRTVDMGPSVVFEDRNPLQIDISGDALPHDIKESLDSVGFQL